MDKIELLEILNKFSSYVKDNVEVEQLDECTYEMKFSSEFDINKWVEENIDK